METESQLQVLPADNSISESKVSSVSAKSNSRSGYFVFSKSNIFKALFNYIIGLNRRKKMMFIIFFSFIVLAVIYLIQITPLYKDSVEIKFHRPISSLSGYDNSSITIPNKSISPIFLKSQSEILRSNTFLSQTLDALTVEERNTIRQNNSLDIDKILFWCQRNLSSLLGLSDFQLLKKNKDRYKSLDFASAIDVRISPDHSAIKITAFSHDPDIATRVINLIARNYSQLSMDIRLKEKGLILDEVYKISSALEANIIRKESEIESYIRQHGLISFEEYEKKLKQLESSILQNKESLKLLTSSKSDDLSADVSSNPDSQLNKLILEKKEVEAIYEQKIIVLKPKHPEILKLQEHIKNLNNEINIEKYKYKKNILQKVYVVNKSLNESQRKITELKQYKDQYQDNYKQLSSLQNQLQALRSQYKLTLQYLIEIPNYQELDFPIITLNKMSPPMRVSEDAKIWLNIFFIVLIGGIGALGVATISYLRGITYHNSRDIEEISKISILADVVTDQIKLFNDNNTSTKLSLIDPICLDYQLLADSVFYSSENGHPKLICCTSVVNDEFDWLTSIGLAIAFAKRNLQVLIIDAHLKKPIINDIFRINNHSGLTNILVSGDSPINSTHQSIISNLHIITSGPSPANAAKLLEGVKLKEFLNNARDSFDLIIINSPAILDNHGLLAIAKLSDAVVVSTFAGKTRQSQLSSGLNKLFYSGINPLGIVFNKNMPIGYKIWKKTQAWSNQKLLTNQRSNND